MGSGAPRGWRLVLCSEFISGDLRTRKALKSSAGGERSRTEFGRGRPHNSYIKQCRSQEGIGYPNIIGDEF
jgi:hypothetical protein